MGVVESVVDIVGIVGKVRFVTKVMQALLTNEKILSIRCSQARGPRGLLRPQQQQQVDLLLVKL